jgi:hypothetical protein
VGERAPPVVGEEGALGWQQRVGEAARFCEETIGAGAIARRGGDDAAVQIQAARVMCGAASAARPARTRAHARASCV